MKKQGRKKSGKRQKVGGAAKTGRKQLKQRAEAEALVTIEAAVPAATSVQSVTESAPELTPEPPSETAPEESALAPSPPESTAQLPTHLASRLPWRNILLTTSAVLCAALLVWGMGNFFLAKIKVGSTSVSSRTSSAALQRLIGADITSYRLGLVYPDGHSASFSLSELGLHPNAAATVTDVRKQQRALPHVLVWWRPVQMQLHTAVDSATLNEFIAQHASIVTKPAQDASLSIDNGAVKITAGAVGKQYGLNNASYAILSAAARLQPTPLRLHSVALQPNVSVPALASAKTQAEAILHQHIDISVGGETVTPSAQDIAAWLSIHPTSKGVDISVDTGKVQGYLNDVAQNHSKAAQSEVISDATDEVLVAGARGISVGDTGPAADDIAKNLLNGGGTATSLPASFTAFKTVHAPTAGKWIEVDVSTKRMYAYDQGEVVRSFLVSAGAPATPTVIGRFAIYAKYRSQNMFGGNADGSEYFQPNVPYVNYFYRDYAIHGNYWRPSSYFGNINSSHGCVGVPVSDGAWIYSWAPIGTPVIVHT